MAGKENDPTSWLEEHGDILFRCAMRCVNQRELAEDLVQETLVSALKSAQTFESRSSERTWLISILRRRVADHIRKKQRTVQETQHDLEFFDEKAQWKNPNRAWKEDPASYLEDEAFREAFECCLAKMPPQIAEPFMRREIEDQDPEKICSEMEISTTNLSTRLYRARLLLQKCLEAHWFGPRRNR